MTQTEMLADLQAELLIARKALMKALVNNDTQDYFDARERISEIELMLKLTK